MTTGEDVKSDVDGEHEDVNIEVVESETYPNGQDIDEQRRAFVIYHMADSDIDGRVLVSNMDQVYRWLKSGETESKHVGLRSVNRVVHNEGAAGELRPDPITNA